MPGLAASAVAWLTRGLAAVAALVLFAMMGLTVVDVFGRYVLHRPVAGSFEVMQFLLAILVFTALPIVSHEREHITVALAEGWLRGRLRRAQELFVLALSAAALAVIASRMWQQGDVLRETQAITGFLLWPIAPIAYFAAVLSGVALALVLVRLGASLRRC
ncbi:MAG TPA: TRAP transporter small permease [Burkholderiales bacterium]|nr:TRAP transporter small permease [Burkholderiales bacterium]